MYSSIIHHLCIVLCVPHPECGDRSYHQGVGSWLKNVGDSIDGEDDIRHDIEIVTLHSILKHNTEYQFRHLLSPKRGPGPPLPPLPTLGRYSHLHPWARPQWLSADA